MVSAEFISMGSMGIHWSKVFLASSIAVMILASGISVFLSPQGSEATTGIPSYDLNEGKRVDVNSLSYTIFEDTKEAVLMGFAEDLEYETLVVPGSIRYNDVIYSVRAINSDAFSGTDITSLVVSDGIVTIGDYAFYQCTKLQSVSIGKDELYMDGAFHCVKVDHKAGICETSLENFVVTDGNPVYSTVDNILYDKDLTKLILCAPMKWGTLDIPDTVTEICSMAFFGSQLFEIYIPDSVKYINNNAFIWCEQLINLRIPESVESIGGLTTPFTVGWCSNMQYLVLSSPRIENSAVTSLPWLRYMQITDSVEVLETSAIRNDADMPYKLRSLVIGEYGSSESDTEPFTDFLFYESETSTEPLAQNPENLSKTAWWSTGEYEDGHLKMYKGYTLTLELNGGVCPIGAMSSGKDGKIEDSMLPLVYKENMFFDGWTDDLGNKITSDYVFDMDTTIYAQFRDEYPVDDPESRFLIIGISGLVFLLVAIVYFVYKAHQ